MGELVQKKTRQKNKARKDKTKTYSQIQEMNLKDRIFMEFMETCPDGTVKDMQQIVKNIDLRQPIVPIICTDGKF